MSPVHSLWARLSALWHGARVREELDEELRSHIAHRADNLERSGMSRADAERQARVEFGGYQRLREETHRALGTHWLETLLWDVRFGLRMLMKARGFTAVALLTLMLGVGATTAVFSLIDALLLRPLPVPHADQLVTVAFQRSDWDSGGESNKFYGFATPFIRGLEKQHGVFQHVAAYWNEKMPVGGKTGNVNISGSMVSGQYFETLDVKPLMGRYLTPQDDQRGGGPNGYVAVISANFWRNWFDRSPHVIGRTLTIANQPFTIVGVMPKPFVGADPTIRPQIYVPLWAEPVVDAPIDMVSGGIHVWWLTTFARRNTGMSLAKTNAALAAVSDQVLRRGVSDSGWIRDAVKGHFRFVAVPAASGFSYLQLQFKKPLMMVFVLCVVLLLLACLNLASLLVARATARERELATRLAIGASRARLVQQLMVESLLVAIAGSGLGVAVSPLLSHFLAALLAGNDSTTVLDTALDMRVLGFSALAALVATLLIGLLPALRATSKELNEQIKGGTHSSPAHNRKRRVLRPLMSLEVGLGLILVIGASLLATSVEKLYRTGLGFQPKGLVNLELSMSQQPLEGPALLHWYERYEDALKHLPGVKSVSFETLSPLGGGDITTQYRNSGKSELQNTHQNIVAPGYFKTMQIPLVAGRDFRWNDTLPEGRRIILNKKAAKLLFGDENPVGREVVDYGKKTYTVVGVVGNAIYESVEKGSPPTTYLPIQQDDFTKKPSYTTVLRITGPLKPIAAATRQLTARMAPEIPAPVMTTMDQVLKNSIRSERMMAMLSMFFAGCALLITGIGLYGTLSYLTAQRTSEIGIRMALGARRGQVMRLVLGENVWVVAVGCVLGLGVALLFSKALTSFLYRISPYDPWVLLASALMLAAVASLASLLPAVRASRIDPMDAIRCE